MKTIFQTLIYLSFACIFLTACANNDDFVTPTLDCGEPTLTANKTIDALYSKIPEGKEVIFYKAEEIISGIVISSDQGGNFYQQLIIVDEKTQTPITIKVDLKGGYALFPIGSKVFLKLNGLYLQHNYGMITFGGGIYTAASGNKYPDTITEGNLKTALFKSCNTLSAADFEPFINNVTIQQLSEDKTLLGKLIRINNVQFDRSIVGETYYAEDAPTNDGQGYTLRTMIDEEGYSLQVRTGKYTNGIKDEIIPNESGTITGIVSEFIGVLQFYPRTIEDMALTSEPFDGANRSPVTPPTTGGKEGNNIDGVDSNMPNYVANFNNWQAFVRTTNKSGLQLYAKQAIAQGINGKTALSIKGTPVGNDYLFITENQTVNTDAKTITMYIKGTSEKSLSFNVYREDGTYAVFNLASDEIIKTKEKPRYNSDQTLVPTQRSNASNKDNGYNDYVSATIQADDWFKITLDLTNVDYNKSGKGNLFGFKVGSKAEYDLLIDEITFGFELEEQQPEPENPIETESLQPKLPNGYTVTQENIYLNLVNETEAKKTINSKWISKSIAALSTAIDGTNIVKVEYDKRNTILFTTKGNEKLKNKNFISFFIKGRSTARAMNIDILENDGQKTIYKLFSPENGQNEIMVEQLKNVNNYESFNIDTKGQWIKVTIDISNINTKIDSDSMILRLGGTSNAVTENKWDLEISSFFTE